MPWFVQTAGAVLTLFFLFGLQAVFHEATEEAAERHAPQVAAGTHAALTALQVQDGEQIYNARCMSCHQANGQGVGKSFPPLVDTEWVTGDKGRLIRVLLDGLSGAIEVNGTNYSGTMPPWRSALDDEEIAEVATYIRTSWGNDASEITADEVERVREATEGRKNPWTADELDEEENQGIPGEEESGEEVGGKR